MSIMQMSITTEACQDHVSQLLAVGNQSQVRLTSGFLAAQPFLSRARYAQFLSAQQSIVAELEPLYAHPLRLRFFPGLTVDGHLRQLRHDLQDLGLVTGLEQASMIGARSGIDTAQLCGGLFVAEGVRLLFPFFRKQAARLGITDEFAGRHLDVSAIDIRRRWSGFAAAVNSMDLSPQDRHRMAHFAEDMMETIQAVIDQEIGRPALARQIVHA